MTDRIGAPIRDLRADLAKQTSEEYGVDVESRRVAGPLAIIVGSTPTLAIRADMTGNAFWDRCDFCGVRRLQ